MQRTVHAPVQFASHSAELLQVMVLPAPKVPSQFAEFEQVTVTLVPPVRSQRAEFAHVTVAPVPTEPLQVEVVSHVTRAPDIAEMVHVAFWLQFVSQPAPPQVWVQEPLMQPHEVAVQEQPAP